VLGKELVDAVLADHKTAPIREPVRAMLGFLQKLTLAPADITPVDAAALLVAGISPSAVVDALYVAYCFNVLDRLADAFAFEVPNSERFAQGARFLLRRGYALPLVAR